MFVTADQGLMLYYNVDMDRYVKIVLHDVSREVGAMYVVPLSPKWFGSICDVNPSLFSVCQRLKAR